MNVFVQTQRKAFGATLVQHPLMENLLTDLCVESEAHTLTAVYLASTYDACEYKYSPATSFEGSLVGARQNASHLPEEIQELFRIGVAVGKVKSILYLESVLYLLLFVCY